MPDNPYYKTAEHRHWREHVLRKAGYLCEECKKYGKMVTATHAHHIEPIAEAPDKKKRISNGIALCTACHNKLEPRSRNGNSNYTY